MQKPRAPRIKSTRELPPCPYQKCNTVKNTGASTKTRWEYTCTTCKKAWYQVRPDLMQEHGWDADVKEVGARNKYLCSACGLPKRGHKCPRKTPSPTSQGKVYMCGKCGVPKRGHVCLKRSFEEAVRQLPTDDIESSLFLPLPLPPITPPHTTDYPSSPESASVCDICHLSIDFLQDDVISSAVACSVCDKRHVHMYCMADMTMAYVCDECAV